MIPANPGATTQRSQKTEVTKQINLYPPLDLNINFIKEDIKIVFYWYLILNLLVGAYSYNLKTRLRYYGFIKFLKIHPQSLGHSGHTKLHHPARGRFHEKFSNPEVTQGNPGITICPHCLDYHQNKKMKSCYSPSILISFSNTRKKEMNSSTR